MREFFRGWKRKLGVATLVLACAFMGMWVRSLQRYDSVILFTRVDLKQPFPAGEYHTLRTIPHGIVWSITHCGGGPSSMEDMKKHLAMLWLNRGSRVVEPKYVSQVLRYHPQRVFGFGLGESQPPSNWPFYAVWMVILPFWAFTLFLSLVSTWLLLTKPRTNNPKSASGP